ncbi:Ubiquinol oxidase 1a, mitochondrial-like protein [Drosera capensis]
MMMSRGATRGARAMIRAVGPRYFSMGPTAPTFGVAVSAEEAAAAGGRKLIIGAPGCERKMMFGFVSGGGDARSLAGLVRFNKGMRASTVALNNKEEREEEKVGKEEEAATEKVAASYWGVQPRKVTKGDGTQWRWTCFMPWETYKSDTMIDLTKHHVPATLMDKMAYWTVKVLRWPTDIFFQRRYGCRAMMLETVAAVPGMVGGLLLHCKSLRKFEHSGGWIKALLEEAENERMHLMTFMEVSQPRWYERALVFAVQGVFFNAYFLAYIVSPKLAHRIVGYLEEEAIHSYTEFLKELDKGNIENVPAPAIAMDYWQLPAGSTLRDVVMVVRADEAHHRDVNHFASDIYYQGRELREAPAPIGYH